MEVMEDPLLILQKGQEIILTASQPYCPLRFSPYLGKTLKSFTDKTHF